MNRLRSDPPITIGWSEAAKREIRELYVEFEKLPDDHKYKPVNNRKLQHIIKHAAIIAIMRDGISTSVFKKIEKKYEESSDGKAAIEQEKAVDQKRKKTAEQLATAQNALTKIQDKKKAEAEPAEEPEESPQDQHWENLRKRCCEGTERGKRYLYGE